MTALIKHCELKQALSVGSVQVSISICNRKRFFRAPNAKFPLPWDTPFPDPPPAQSFRSLTVLLGGPLTRISDKKK